MSISIAASDHGSERAALNPARARRRSVLARSRPLAGHDLEEGLVALHLALGSGALLGALVGALRGVTRLLEAGLEGRAVDRVRRDRLLHEHERRVVDHLEVPLALREADHVGLGLVEAQLSRLEDG